MWDIVKPKRVHTKTTVLTSGVKILLYFDVIYRILEGPSISDVNPDELGVASADPLLGQQANKPKDHQVFIYLVDFCR